MIGGFDIALEETVDPQDVDILLRVALAAWPEGVVERADGSVVTALGAALRRSWPHPSELFIYETHDAFESWTSSGLTDDNANCMVAVTAEDDCVSFVVNDATGPAHDLVAAMIDALKRNRWLGRKAAA